MKFGRSPVSKCCEIAQTSFTGQIDGQTGENMVTSGSIKSISLLHSTDFF